MPLDDYLARKDWIAPRQDRWSDILPESWQTAINTSPTLNALARYMSRPSFEEGVKQWQDSIPGNSPIDRIADRKSTLAQEFPQPMNPLGQSMLETGGFLANFIGPGAKLPPASAPKPQGIRAYHGSPHDFDKFDISKIGTGEGNQAYGRGLYFAESEGVAKSYRDKLKRTTVDGVPWSSRNPEHVAAGALDYSKGDLAAAKQYLLDNINFQGHPPELRKIHQDALAVLETKGAPALRKDDGRMYEVRINADPETFLDWDKPLSQQPEAVQKLIAEHPRMGPAIKNWANRSDGQGQAVWHAADELTKDPMRAADALKNAGIPGIKYKDQMSRGTDGGTSNYVVFDDKMIEILRKYGLLPPVAAGAAQALSQGQDTAY